MFWDDRRLLFNYPELLKETEVLFSPLLGMLLIFGGTFYFNDSYNNAVKPTTDDEDIVFLGIEKFNLCWSNLSDASKLSLIYFYVFFFRLPLNAELFAITLLSWVFLWGLLD